MICRHPRWVNHPVRGEVRSSSVPPPCGAGAAGAGRQSGGVRVPGEGGSYEIRVRGAPERVAGGRLRGHARLGRAGGAGGDGAPAPSRTRPPCTGCSTASRPSACGWSRSADSRTRRPNRRSPVPQAEASAPVHAVLSRSRAGSRRLPAGACARRRPRSPQSPRRGGRHEPPHPWKYCRCCSLKGSPSRGRVSSIVVSQVRAPGSTMLLITKSLPADVPATSGLEMVKFIIASVWRSKTGHPAGRSRRGDRGHRRRNSSRAR